MKYSFLFVFSVFFLQLLTAPAQAQSYRGLSGGSLTLDDSLGHTITLETPKPGDAGYAAWIAGGGGSVWKLPIPPFPNANAGFVLPGDTDGQLLVWVAAAGPQGAWEPMSIAGLNIGGGGGGGISGSGSPGTIPIWTGEGTTLGNSHLTDNGVTLSYNDPNINTGVAYQIGDTTVLTAPGNTNIFVGGLAGANNGTGTSNTALGFQADFGLAPLTNATAIGANAFVTQSNSMVLGSIPDTNGASTTTSVGIGISAPAAALDIHGYSNDALHLTSFGNYDILGDSWNVNTSGQIVAGGTDQPVSDANVTLDFGHLGAIGNQPGNAVSTDTYDSNETTIPDLFFNQFSCGSNDVAGLVDFNINHTQSGQYVEIDFNQSYTGSEIVTLTPANAASASNINAFYVQVNPSGNYFWIVNNGNATNFTDYQFYYHVIDVRCQGFKNNQHQSPH